MIKSDLVDAEELARKNPESFEIESLHERQSIRVGDLVKVSDGRERFWIRVEWRGVKPARGGMLVAYAGVVMNETASRELGSAIAFEPRHVYEIDAASPRVALRSTLSEN